MESETSQAAAEQLRKGASPSGSKTLASLQKKHRELTERIRLAAKKERQAVRKRRAARHLRLGALVADCLPLQPGWAADLLQRAEAARWPADDRAWLAQLARAPSMET